MVTLDPDDPLHMIVTIDGVELTSDEIRALRASVDVGLGALAALQVEAPILSLPSLAPLRRVQKLLAGDE